MEKSEEHADITVSFRHGRKAAGKVTAHVWLRGAGEDGLPAVVAKGTAWLRGTGEPTTVTIDGWEPADSWDLTSPGSLWGEWIATARRVPRSA